jgi:hypothetical protein
VTTMTTGSVLLALALLALVGLFVVQPLLDTRRRRRPRKTVRLELLTEKAALLAQIQALDFDFETGKLPPPAYQNQRAHLVDLAKEVLRQLDRLDQLAKGDGGVQPAGEVRRALAVEADIDAAVARLRERPAQSHRPAAETSADRVRERGPAQNGAGKFCPQCGRPTDPGDKFCASCGHKLNLPQSA